MAGSPFRRRRNRDRSPAPTPDPASEVISAAARTNAFTAPAGASTWSDTSASPASAEVYSAWAQRLRQKRMEAQQVIAGDATDAGESDPHDTNWSTQHVFAESERVAGNDPRAHRDPVGISAAYAVLGLEPGASLDEVDARYRALAKRHHPDRFIGDSADIQREHAEQFRAASTARDVIRQSRATL